jgi:NADH-quinone oxidoreductase subunit K
MQVSDAVLLAQGDASQIQIGQIGSVPASWFLVLGAALFCIGVVGVMVRRNPIVLLICTELMLNAVNLTLVTFSRQLQNLQGQLFALLVIVVAAAEAVVGLAILVDIFRTRNLDDIDDLSELKG